MTVRRDKQRQSADHGLAGSESRNERSEHALESSNLAAYFGLLLRVILGSHTLPLTARELHDNAAEVTTDRRLSISVSQTVCARREPQYLLCVEYIANGDRRRPLSLKFKVALQRQKLVGK